MSNAESLQLSDNDTDINAVDSNNGDSARKRTTRTSSSPVMIANDVIAGHKKELEKLHKQQKDTSADFKELKKQVEANHKESIESNKNLQKSFDDLFAILKRQQQPSSPLPSVVSSTSSSSSSTDASVQSQVIGPSVIVAATNIDGADDTQFTLGTQSLLLPPAVIPQTIRKRDRVHTYGITVDGTPGGYDSDNDKHRKNKSKASLTIQAARTIAIDNLDDSEIRIFNPSLAEHSKVDDAPAIKSVQVMHTCLSLMMQLVVKRYVKDPHILSRVVDYLGQMENLCGEYNSDACISDLLDLDLHCRSEPSKWTLNEDSSVVRKFIRQLQSKMISSMQVERERAYNGNSKSASFRNQRATSSSNGKSSQSGHRGDRNLRACFKWNGKDSSGAWTGTSHCDKSDEACTFNHICAHCGGGHQRFSRDGCKHRERDGKSDSK
jgi:hypothetical protein